MFSFKYPTTKTGEQILAQMLLPTRKGYTATGWKYYDSENAEYVSIDENNVIDLLQQVAFDVNNVESVLNIYVVWEIDYYNVNVSGDNLHSFEITGASVSGNATDGYSVRYYTDIEIAIEGEYGYKTQLLSVKEGDYGLATLDDVGKTNATATIERVGSDIDFKVEFVDIIISITVDTNIPQFTNREEKNDTSASYRYHLDLEEMTESDLPALKVTEGTYNLVGYTYNDGTYDIDIEDETLNQYVNNLI